MRTIKVAKVWRDRGAQFTYRLIWAAAQDAGNRHARKHGRTVWEKADYDVACDEIARLMPFKCELCGEPAGEGNALCPACAESR